MRRALRAIAHRERAHTMRDRGDLCNRIHRAQCIRHVPERDDLRILRDELAQFPEIDLACRRQLANLELRTDRQRELLPRYEVGMMLESCNDDAIALLHVRMTP